MKREKIITIRVNEELYNKVTKIINERTTSVTVHYRNSKKTRYEYNGKETKGYFGKFTIADLVENAFRDFIEKSNTL